MLSITAILVLQSTLCLTIKVPVAWDDASEKPVTQDNRNEYFQYTANKPQFAVDVAKFHDVKLPEKHFESYPVEPLTGASKANFGQHQLLNSAYKNYKPYQKYVNTNHHAKPISNYYEVYHPYQAETPALQEIYKDPVLQKIRNDVRDSKNRLQGYENNPGETDSSSEYLERPEDTDKKKVPQHNVPLQFEVHRPMRRPIYYHRIPVNHNREHILNHKIRHPWTQDYAKVRPMHYRPLKHNIQQLRQQHAMTYDDDRNEYPQLAPPESYDEKPDGYDIYERGKDKYQQIRNDFDESISKAVQSNRPVESEKLELQKDDYKNSETENDEEMFVPIKNYAQVRKTETYKHLPRSAAFDDADNLEEIKNAPRLREAVKSSKNQVVYSEEGYEDSAYDHAGEQKHASDHEGHGGFLKENELSRGKYKIPTIDTGYSDQGKTSSRDQVLHGEKWNDEEKKIKDENESEDYIEEETEYDEKADLEKPESVEDLSERSKCESKGTENNSTNEHEVSKRQIPLSNLYNISDDTTVNKTFRINNTKSSKQLEKLRLKYPYYFEISKNLDKHSPLRYSENLKLMPKKKIDNSAFYNSRTSLECPEVDREINPIPEKFKNDDVAKGSDDEDYNNDKGEAEFKNLKNKQRLKGLGDKIDCLKAKYFGEDPLDSPFFKEELIKSPEPVLKPHSKVFFTNKNSPEDILIHDKTEVKTDTTTASNNSNFESTPENKPLTQDALLRKKRAAVFMYEPYKIIKESQYPEAKKLTTTSNISPLIRKLQTRQVIDKTLNSERTYKDIGKNDRPVSLMDSEFVDISMDPRRGEPRYELDLKNHRPHYSPTVNKTAMTVAEFKTLTNENENDKNSNFSKQIRESKRLRSPSNNKTHIHLSKHQNIAASNIVAKIISTTTEISPTNKQENIDDDEYDEYEDYEDEEDLATTTTTTEKVVHKKRIRIATTAVPKTTENPHSMKLHLVTRFHTTTTDAPPITSSEPREFRSKEHNPAKYREKKKKTTKTTLVTDSESYGDDTDDMKRDEIDAMIGIKQDMNDYTPSYEKEEELSDKSEESSDDDESEDDDDEDEEEDDDEDYEDDENGDIEQNVSKIEKGISDEYVDKQQNQGEGKNIENTNLNQHTKTIQEKSLENVEMTTSEPTKRTLVRTTEPSSTTEVLYRDMQPKVFRKKVEVHREVPVNTTSPHKTHYKQDIKEVEIIKELDMPKIKNENPASLDLYRDENLAKEINNLGDIEIFKDDLDLESGPRHGGNYRSIQSEDISSRDDARSDVDSSETKTKKIVQLETSTVNKKQQGDNSRKGRYKDNSKEKVSDTSTGSTKRNEKRRRNNNEKSAKLIELQDDDDFDTRHMHGGNFRAHVTRNNNRPMHGGNYRSGKLVNSEDVTTEAGTIRRNTSRKRNRKSEAELLNAYAKAVSEITTTPAYILDPSKRMYYYLE
ncbi:unnamed protein product [Leptosia nina]|uniref:Uncharacterized protein n=1 Tax=Leptosia nina TaxID=320188 RepID=A0AAV1JUZ5_9NEOP